MKIKTDTEFVEKAIALVSDYTNEHTDKSDEKPIFDVFIVWQCKALQNFKALLSTTLFDITEIKMKFILMLIRNLKIVV